MLECLASLLAGGRGVVKIESNVRHSRLARVALAVLKLVCRAVLRAIDSKNGVYRQILTIIPRTVATPSPQADPSSTHR